ncbi:MAG: GNAT family N-acetyltransferase [Nodularia sp. (in: Bacteria)]|nr:MAG: GNAT family N-acetyltransferase [Nodularia sp. (in: cyanobacteria)]
MKLRRYEIGDTEEIIQLFYNTIHEVNIRDYTKAQVDAWTSVNMDVEVWMNSLNSKFTYVAEKDDKILGFGELEANGHIDRFYCHKDFQGQGVGTKILDQIELTARDLEIKKLFVEASITAKPFFEKNQFMVVQKQEVERQDQKLINFVMEKILPPVSSE